MKKHLSEQDQAMCQKVIQQTEAQIAIWRDLVDICSTNDVDKCTKKQKKIDQQCHDFIETIKHETNDFRKHSQHCGHYACLVACKEFLQSFDKCLADSYACMQYSQADSPATSGAAVACIDSSTALINACNKCLEVKE